METVCEYLDKKGKCICFDLSKAFDLVTQTEMLSKLQNYEIRGIAFSEMERLDT